MEIPPIGRIKFSKIINNPFNMFYLTTANLSLHREENIRTLISLGVTGTQAKICLALVRIGASTISEIADASEVARPDTYRAAVELEKKGLIEKIVSTPTKYELLPLPEVLSILTGRRETESRELKERTVSLLKEYENLTDKQHINGSQFVLVPSGNAFSNRLQKLIKNSKKNICIIAGQKTLTQFLDFVLEIFERTNEKGANIRIVTEKSKNNSNQEGIQSAAKGALRN